jgi:hypothetical protein
MKKCLSYENGKNSLFEAAAIKVPQINPGMARRPDSTSKKNRENMYGIDHCQAQSSLAKSGDQANMQPKLQRRRRLCMTRPSISIFSFVET